MHNVHIVLYSGLLRLKKSGDKICVYVIFCNDVTPSLVFFVFFCGFKLPSGVTCFQPEESPSVCQGRQVCKQEKLLVLFGNVFISPSFLRDSFAGYRVLDRQFFLEYFEHVIPLSFGFYYFC